MTNKINGTDVSEYFIEVVDEGGSTIDYKILPNSERLLVEKIFEQNQQLKNLQEENEELKNKIEIMEQKQEDIAEARMEICNQCGEKTDYNIPCKMIRDLDYGLQIEIEENEKYKQTLEEIREILQNINEVLNERYR